MKIRNAKIDDIDQIFKIYKSVSLDRSQIDNLSYQVKVQKHGFLLGLESRNDFELLLHESHAFLVYEEKNKILGYIIADHRDKFLDDEYKTWYDLEAKDVYYSSDLAMTIASIATDPDQTSKGIATCLENKLEDHLKKQNFTSLFSIVSLAPLTNCPSLIFHTQRQFQKIAFGRPRKLFNLENYASTLLMKMLS